MVQGAVKKSTKSAAPSKTKQQQQLKKGPRVFKQKGSKGSAAKTMKKFNTGMIRQTEALLGERAGHLELIGQGKKARKPGINAQKGGTKKFG